MLTRMRDRAAVHTYTAHRAALPRLRALLTSSDPGHLDISALMPDGADGYLPETELDAAVRSLGLRVDEGGSAVLRVTGFDFDTVRHLVKTPVVAALDAGTSSDPRARGAGLRTLDDLLQAYR
ncbi:hypothetical protein [Myceligenerans xiligouense]|uniref:hypothetical protein n=1 Tax=Myceligenerans xiligouense TaxID=253184 RepID=UPI001FE8E177|nr:hypothetical protein [Myceligenerans xiligouense]